ncbi:Zinc finger and Nuclear hormone receptor domain containing protein [Dirofilaria immitis]|nr:Zinc finger and Nuclear hormone receptor domain containing protein [Dirofilaria immitis]
MSNDEAEIANSGSLEEFKKLKKGFCRNSQLLIVLIDTTVTFVSARATGYHFEAQSCGACAAFFRRAIVHRKVFSCKTGFNNCTTEKAEKEYYRSFVTKSGLKRNKRFCGEIGQNAQTFSSGPQLSIFSSPLPVIDSLQNDADSRNSPKNDGNDSMLLTQCSGVIEYNYTVLHRLVAEELKIGERRRILFCERPLGNILGRSQSCVGTLKDIMKEINTHSYTTEEIFPLRFRKFRKSIRTHILLVYEWLRSWPAYDSFNKFDQITFLRKCVLYHTILDPSYITLQIGYPNRFVMQNGGFLSIDENCKEGWEDEKEISSATKQKYF